MDERNSHDERIAAWVVTYIGPDGERTKTVPGRNREQAKKALRKLVPTAHVVHVELHETHDCPARDTLFDILDLEAGYVAPQIAALSAEEKLALIYKIAKKGLSHGGE